MSSDRPSPSKDLLPPFRVRQVRLPAGDAVVRMKKAGYDELLKRQPDAALRYIDESDGEVILVCLGSRMKPVLPINLMVA